MKKNKQVARSVAKKVDALDATGAGDIFAGTFLGCKIQNNSDLEALITATNTATLSVTQQGIEHLF